MFPPCVTRGLVGDILRTGSLDATVSRDLGEGRYRRCMAVSPPPSPGPELTAAERTRYARHLLLPGFGADAQRRLRGTSVLVVGAGGLGSPVLQYLAAAGVGRIGIADDDVVEETNLQRQVVHRTADVGRPKVDSAAEAVRALNPGVEVVAYAARLEPANVLDIAREHDIVVDGADNFPTRYLTSDACVRLGLPHVWGSIFRFEAQVSVWWASRGPCYRCVFPVPPAAGTVPSCAVGGVLGAMCGVVGSLLAGEAIKVATGVGEPLIGRLLVHDSLRARFDVVPVVRNAACPSCGVPAGAGVAELFAGPDAQPADPPAPVPELDVVEAAALLEFGNDVLLLDVREPGEREVVALDGSLAIPLAELAERVGELPGGRRVLVYCKTGGRSAAAVRLLREQGVDAHNVAGGILDWARRLRPDLPTY